MYRWYKMHTYIHTKGEVDANLNIALRQREGRGN